MGNVPHECLDLCSFDYSLDFLSQSPEIACFRIGCRRLTFNVETIDTRCVRRSYEMTKLHQAEPEPCTWLIFWSFNFLFVNIA